MDRESLLTQLDNLLPLAEEWAAAEEERALREGVPLSVEELADARAIGVEAPDRVRLLRVEQIPAPLHPQLRGAVTAIRFLGPETRGLTLRYGIFVRWDCWRSRPLVAHELAHTVQYERSGGILPFLRQYIGECLTIGYANAPMELEAGAVAARILARP
ncbi:MAG: hypothetical protein QOI34_1725 [Verrucomicrobiota bacterium]|jgi:hypothetical protein